MDTPAELRSSLLVSPVSTFAITSSRPSVVPVLAIIAIALLFAIFDLVS